VLVKVLNSIQEVLSDWLGGILFEAPFLESTPQGSLAYRMPHRMKPGDYLSVHFALFDHLLKLLFKIIHI
jgi:aspartyl-tRNA synthetase